MKIVIGGDHGGFSLKKQVIEWLETAGHSVKDYGTFDQQSCDYPDFAFLVAIAVARGEAERGVLVDSTGIASAMVANKVPGVRAHPVTEPFAAHSSREHNNSNLLCLGAQLIGQGLAKKIVDTWLNTEFGGDRHQRRLDKLSLLEKQLFEN